MNVYSLSLDVDHYQSLELVDLDSDWEAMYKFDGNSIEEWQPLRAKVFFDDELETQLPPGDFPSLFADEPALSQRAVQVLRPLIEGNGQLLPLQCTGGEYFILNVTNVVDALDERQSEIVRFPDGKRVLDIKRFVFVPAKLQNVDIFKLPQQPLGRVFVTDGFVKTVRDAGLVGINFEWLWSSEQQTSSTLQVSKKVQ